MKKVIHNGRAFGIFLLLRAQVSPNKRRNLWNFINFVQKCFFHDPAFFNICSISFNEFIAVIRWLAKQYFRRCGQLFKTSSYFDFGLSWCVLLHVSKVLYVFIIHIVIFIPVLKYTLSIIFCTLSEIFLIDIFQCDMNFLFHLALAGLRHSYVSYGFEWSSKWLL